jgi:uncharacterized membrane protein
MRAGPGSRVERQDARRTAVTAIAGRMTEQDRARELPHEHVPRLVVSRDVSGEGPLDRVADRVNWLVGSMWLFVGVSVGIVAWLFAGNVVGFDRTPWPLLLTVLNLPQLSIMISLQVSANRAQAASDARAMADHSTLVALTSSPGSRRAARGAGTGPRAPRALGLC